MEFLRDFIGYVIDHKWYFITTMIATNVSIMIPYIYVVGESVIEFAVIVNIAAFITAYFMSLMSKC